MVVAHGGGGVEGVPREAVMSGRKMAGKPLGESVEKSHSIGEASTGLTVEADWDAILRALPAI